MVIGQLLALLALAGPETASLAASLGVPPDAFAQRMLDLHNRERAAVGAPPLRWDPILAESAARYGPELALLGRLVHSPRETRPGQRENLAMGSTGAFAPEDLLGFWVNEKRAFTPGVFPAVSTTGNWHDIAHYTQMIWRDTTNVGCALYRGNGKDFLICRYSPPGNADGKPVY